MRSIAYKGVRFASLTLLLVLALAACGTESHPANTPPRTAPAPLKLSVAGTDRYIYTTPQSMCSTLLTAEVIVGSHGASKWNTVDGRKPQISDPSAIVRRGYFIYTPITFSSFRALIDGRPHFDAQFEAQFVTTGGIVGQDQFDGPLPQLDDGGHYVLIFAPASEPKTHRTADFLIVYQAFPIDAQGMVTLQQAGPLHEPGPGTPQPEITLSLADLSQQLAKC